MTLTMLPLILKTTKMSQKYVHMRLRASWHWQANSLVQDSLIRPTKRAKAKQR